MTESLEVSTDDGVDETWRDVREWRIRYGAYPLEEMGDGPAVWGATARFLGQLGALLGNP